MTSTQSQKSNKTTACTVNLILLMQRTFAELDMHTVAYIFSHLGDSQYSFPLLNTFTGAAEKEMSICVKI